MKKICFQIWMIPTLIVFSVAIGVFLALQNNITSSLQNFDNAVQIKNLGVSFRYPSLWGAFSYDLMPGKKGTKFAVTFDNKEKAPLIGGITKDFAEYRNIRLTDAYGFDLPNCKIQFAFRGINDMPPHADPKIKCVEKITTNTMNTYYLRVSDKYDDSKQLIFHPNQLIGIVPLDNKISAYGVAIIVMNNDGKNISSKEFVQKEMLMKKLLGSFEKVPEKAEALSDASDPFLVPLPPPSYLTPPEPFFIPSTPEEEALWREDNILHQKLKKFEEERRSKEEIWNRRLETGRSTVYQNKDRGIYMKFPSNTLYVASKNKDDFLRESFNIVFCINAPKSEKYCDLNADGEVVVREYQLAIDPKNSIPINENFMHALCKVHVCRENNAIGEVIRVGERLFFKQKPETYYFIKGSMLYEMVFNGYGADNNISPAIINSMLTNFKP